MKKIIITVSALILTGVVLYGILSLIPKRTPESILKVTFDISLTNFDYSFESFEEEWFGNGDGHVFIIYKFNTLTQENIEYLKEFDLQLLPMPDSVRLQTSPSSLPSMYKAADVGYYTYKVSPTHHRDFKIFIVDTKKNIAILYYQCI